MNFGVHIQQTSALHMYEKSFCVCMGVCKMCRVFINTDGDVWNVYKKLIAFAFGLENYFGDKL